MSTTMDDGADPLQPTAIGGRRASNATSNIQFRPSYRQREIPTGLFRVEHTTGLQAMKFIHLGTRISEAYR